MNSSEVAASRLRALNVVRHCGRSIQIGAALFLLAGVSGFIVRVVTGEWPEFLGRSLSTLFSAGATTLITLFGVAGIWFGKKIMRGSLRATRMFTVIAWLFVMLSTAILIATAGDGWYEVLLWLFLAVDSSVALAYMRDVA